MFIIKVTHISNISRRVYYKYSKMFAQIKLSQLNVFKKSYTYEILLWII